MVFGFGIKNKTVKELRKNMGFTAKELAEHTRLNTSDILKIDNLKLKEVPARLKKKIFPVLRGDSFDKIPWL